MVGQGELDGGVDDADECIKAVELGIDLGVGRSRTPESPKAEKKPDAFHVRTVRGVSIRGKDRKNMRHAERPFGKSRLCRPWKIRFFIEKCLHRPKKRITFAHRFGKLHGCVFRRVDMVDVAQLVRVTDCGSEGRGFESLLPPQKRAL